jgi:hypothetical protein
MRTLLALAALPLLATFAPFHLYREPPVPARATIAFKPIALDREDPYRTSLGGLTFLGGWEVSSNDPRFGGISAMHVEDGRVLAISDSGSIIEYALPGQPPRLSIRPLPLGPGPGGKLDRDSEALAVHGSRAWIGFERHNAIWRYGLAGWRAEAAAEPHAMRRWPGNQGSEAMVRLPDGRFLVFSEQRLRPDGSSEVILFDGDPAVPGTRTASLGYRAPLKYRITDAALLPDGRLLFLNRRFSLLHGISAKLTVGDMPRLSAGSVLTGTEIAHFDEPINVDNMEAVSVVREPERTILWIGSDDNFTALQRTLLLKFMLDEE